MLQWIIPGSSFPPQRPPQSKFYQVVLPWVMLFDLVSLLCQIVQNCLRFLAVSHFKSCFPHQTSIIRTRSSKLEMGSDYFFSSNIVVSITAWRRKQTLGQYRSDISSTRLYHFHRLILGISVTCVIIVFLYSAKNHTCYRTGRF